MTDTTRSHLEGFETYETSDGVVRLRIERSFYAIDEDGQTIDGPFQDRKDAIAVARDQLIAALEMADADEPISFRKRMAILPSDAFEAPVRAWIYDDSPIGGEDDTAESHYHILEMPASEGLAERYYLCLGTEEHYSNDLDELERLLAAFMEDEGSPLPKDMAH